MRLCRGRPSGAEPDITPAVRADIAPTGKLRAGINYGNVILATKDRATGESRGVAVDLMQEIGRRLGVPVEIVAYDSVAVMGDAAPMYFPPGLLEKDRLRFRGYSGIETFIHVADHAAGGSPGTARR